MNKRLTLVLFIISLFIINMNICYAEIYMGKITGDSVRLRLGPGTNYDLIASVNKGNEYRLVDNTLYPSEQECENGWYKINYNNSIPAYVCSDFISISTLVINEDATSECENRLKELGFPSSYWPGLCRLNETRPNWIFTPVMTGLDWSDAVNRESACGKSYIASSVATNIDSSCTNQYTSTWYPASSSAVAYYMDPRNWFTESTIFQFENNSYNLNLNEIYSNAASYSIRNAEFYKYHLNLGNNLGDVLNQVGNDTNVSPVFLASRMLQELGSKTKLYNLYSGVYDGNDGIYLGFYNFYNIGVSDKCATTEGTTICGLRYAYNNGWNSLYNSIKGGASQIYNNYIDAGQYSNYFQKFNLVPKNSNSLYLHQYMTNIAAPSSESKTIYNAYKSLEILDNAFNFYIPVFNNIDNSMFYETNGAVLDTNDEETPSTIDISTIIVGSGYKYSDNYLMGINPNTNVNDIKNTIESIAGSGSVIVTNSEGIAVTEGLIGTGYQIIISNASEKVTLIVIISGDTSGDGLINALDLLQIQKNILNTFSLSDHYFKAGDTSKDGKINALDLLQVQKNILGTYTIEQ